MPRGNDLDTVLNSVPLFTQEACRTWEPKSPNLNYSSYEIYLKGILAKYKDKIKYWEVDTNPIFRYLWAAGKIIRRRRQISEVYLSNY